MQIHCGGGAARHRGNSSCHQAGSHLQKSEDGFVMAHKLDLNQMVFRDGVLATGFLCTFR